MSLFETGSEHTVERQDLTLRARNVRLSVNALALLCLWVGCPVLARSVTIDGWFEDWSEVSVSSNDPVRDGLDPFDLTYVAVQTEGTRVYVRFRLATACGLQNGPADEQGLRLVVSSRNSRRGVKVDFRNKMAEALDKPGTRLLWNDLDYTCLPTFASREYELCLDTKSLGFNVGDEIFLNFEGSDALHEPLIVQLKESAESLGGRQERLVERSGEIRVSCFNTYFNGLRDPTRQEAIGRLMSVVQSDVYCFVEEDDEAAFDKSVRQIIPHTGQLGVAWRNGKGIASQLPLVSVPCEDLVECCPAMLTTRAGHRLIVLVAHLECCGYPSSPEDHRRVLQAESIAKYVKRLQSGDLGAVYRDMPVIVVGDLNLVGTRRPLSVLELVGGLTEARLKSLSGRDGVTWRSLNGESYAPGRLDYLTYDAARMRRTGGGVVDSGKMSESLASRLNIRAEDSLASDHLLIFGDFLITNQPLGERQRTKVESERPTVTPIKDNPIRNADNKRGNRQ